MTFKVPILLIAYNRPSCISRVIENLKNLKPTKLYIACDGPNESIENNSPIAFINIRKIFETIADAGQRILEKKPLANIKKKSLIELCDDLLSSKGAAFGITLARDILFRYHNISADEKLKFNTQVSYAITKMENKLRHIYIGYALSEK